MKTRKWIIGLVLAMFTFAAVGQDKNAQSQPGVDDIEEGDRPGTSDTPGAEQAARAANTDAGNETDSATQLIPQKTSSQSGSPAVLSEQNGAERDGTNNVQRATMNMAGSPVENIDFGDEQTIDVDSEMEDRQDRTQKKQSSAQAQGNNPPTESSEMSDNTREENNAASDQNLSSKNKQSGAKDDKKNEKRKKKKDKG